MPWSSTSKCMHDCYVHKTPLFYCIKKQYSKAATLLILCGAEIDNDNSILITCIKSKLPEVAKLLIERGANIKTQRGIC